jgi:hypothetical protein
MESMTSRRIGSISSNGEIGSGAERDEADGWGGATVVTTDTFWPSDAEGAAG